MTPPGPSPESRPQSIIRRPPRLAELATWPSAWREAWGRRANELDEAGVPWPEHETQAFDEIKALKAKGGPPPPARIPDAEMKRATKEASKTTAKKAEKTGTLGLKPS